jgi:hypothetical protein
MLTSNMTMKQSQNERPSAPPREPMFSVATAIFALNLERKDMLVGSFQSLSRCIMNGRSELSGDK